MTKEEFFAKHSIPLDYDTEDVISFFKEKGGDGCDEFQDLLDLGTYRGSCWQGAEADVGISGGYYEEIEFEDYPDWAMEILNEVDGEFLSTTHEKEAERHMEDPRW